MKHEKLKMSIGEALNILLDSLKSFVIYSKQVIVSNRADIQSKNGPIKLLLTYLKTNY